MPVRVESAGDHAFDLAHIRRQRGEELVELLLERAGFEPEQQWRLQVQKKLTCTSETPPVRVVDEPKKWAIYLKIKPGDNDSCHYCSLLMPEGLQGQNVYPLLKRVALELDRNWRNQAVDDSDRVQPHQGTAAINGVLPVPGGADTAARERSQAELGNEVGMELGNEVEAELGNEVDEGSEVASGDRRSLPVPGDSPGLPSHAEKTRLSLRGWLGDRDKTRLVLLAIHEINGEGPYPQNRFAEVLRQRMGWEGASRYEIGGVLTWLVRKDYIIRKLRGSRPFGYELSEEGRRLIEDLIHPAPAPSAPGRSVPGSRDTADPAEIIQSLGRIAKQFLDVSTRLDELTSREAELVAELERLRQERDQLCRVLDDREVRTTLSNLLQFRRRNE